MQIARQKSEMRFFVLFWVIVTLFYFCGQIVFAQETAQAVSYPALDQATEIVNSLNGGWVVTIAILVVEFLLRAVKTQNPKSLLYVLSNAFGLIAKVFTWLATICDKVLQRTKD